VRLLALDIGTRHTGIAFGETEMGVPLALETIEHQTPEELADFVCGIARERKIDRVIVGLPLLPSGSEGSQSDFVRGVAEILERNGLSCSFLDERYTTPRHGESNGDAAAACNLLQTAFERDLTKL
jgi:putative transcription antitermination factor YqgF